MPTTTQHSAANNDSWGLPPGLKLEDTLRLGFQNFGGFPELSSHSKNDAYRSFIPAFDFDIFGVSETNLNWGALSAESQFQERIRNTWEKHILPLHIIEQLHLLEADRRQKDSHNFFNMAA
jgi:hypothetical protein